MDLSSPIRSLIPSLDSAVLEVLARTTSGLRASQITRLARRGTRPGQHAVLNRLVEHGLVIADQANTGSMYRLNRDHLLTPSVLLAVNVEYELHSRLTRMCAALDPVPLHVSVFGSHARSEATVESDIDLMVIVDDDVDVHDSRWTDQIDGLEDQVFRWTGKRLEPLVLTLKRFRSIVDAREPLVTTWATDAHTVLGPMPHDLVVSFGEDLR